MSVPVNAKFNESGVRQQIEAVTKNATAKIKVDFDDGGAKAKIATLKSELTDKTLAIRVTTDEAKARISALQAQIAATKAKIAVDTDDAEAVAKLKELQDQVKAIRGKMDLDTAPARAAADEIRADISRRNAQLKVDLDAAKARAELEELERPKDATVNVNADTGAADAKIAAVGDSAGIAGGQISALIAAGVAIAPAIVPVAAAAAGALAGIGSGALAGAAGVGVLVLGLSGIVSAVSSVMKAQSAQGASSAASAAAQVASAQRIQGAEAALANARASASDAARRASQAVQQAQQGVQTATQQAAAGVASAISQEASAEQTLRNALQQETSAQQALSDARKQAKRDLEDLANSVTDAALSQRQAAIDVERAKAALDALPKNASAVQRQQAQLDYDQALQHQKELALQQKRLIDQQKAAQKAGISGAPGVVSAQQGVSQAQQAVLNARKGVADAEKAIAAARVAGAQQINKAEQALANAEAARTSQARQSAYSVAQAQRSLEAAYVKTGTAGSTAGNAASKALAELTPEGRKLVDFITGTIIPGVKHLADIAQAPISRGILAGLLAAAPLVPVVTGIVRTLAGVLGDLFTQAGKALGSPFWVNFFRLISGIGAQVIGNLGKIIGNLATGFAGILTAFAPVGKAIGDVLVRMSASFRDFGTGKGGGLQRFFDYVQQVGPRVAATIGALVGAAGHILVALAPLGNLSLTALKDFADWVRTIPTGRLTTIAGAIAAVVLAMKGLPLAVGAIKGVGSAIGFLASGPVGYAVAAIALLAGGLVLVYTHSKTFRDFITEKLIPGLENIGRFVLREVTPAFRDLWGRLQDLGKVVGPIIADLFHTFVSVGKQNLPTIKGIFLAVLDIIKGTIELVAAIIHRVTQAISVLWANWGGTIKTVIRTVFPLILTIIKDTLDRIAAFIHLITDVINGNWSDAWKQIKRIAQSYINDVKAIIGVVLKVIRGIWSAYADWVKGLWHNFWGALKYEGSQAINAIKSGIFTGLSAVQTMFRNAVGAISRIWNTIQNIAKAPVRFIVQTVLENGLLAAFRSISHLVGFGAGANFHVGLPRGFDRGGWTGPGDKYKPAGIVHADEFVINKESRRRIEAEAPGYLDQLNGYAVGGLVTDTNRRFRPVKGGRIVQGIHDVSTGFPAIDIAVPIGTDVAAAASGRVTVSKDLRGYEPRISHQNGYYSYGKYIVIDSGTFQTLYAHLSQRGVHVGQQVGGGTRIGLSGLTGHTYGPHLHFGARGISPYAFMSGATNFSGAVGNVSGNGSSVDTSGFFSSVGNALAGLSKLGSSPFVQMLGGIPRKIASSLESKVTSLAQNFVTGFLGTANPKSGFGTTGNNRERGRSLMKQFGYPDSQWPFLDKLWTRESNWNERAQNPSSGAYGIPQALPGSKMASVAVDWRVNPNTQIMWGLPYIKQRYGDPAGAWAHETQYGWYDKGGWLNPGTTVVHNNTGRPEPVFTGNQFDQLLAARSGGGATINQHFPVSASPMAAAAVAGQRVVSEMAARGF